MSLIRHIEIIGLNDHLDVSIPISGPHCVIVGPNGSGKSTALLIVAAALGRQWKRLSELRFARLVLTFDSGASASLSRLSCKKYVSTLSSYGRRMPARVMKSLQEGKLLNDFLSVDFRNSSSVEKYSELLRLAPVELRHLQGELQLGNAGKGSEKEVVDFQSLLEAENVPTTIYLPTYRRIELELKKIFDQVPDAYRSVLSTQVNFGSSNEFIVEMVRFGMEDVKSTIQTFEKETREYARNRFNRMMTSYLKEMANSQVLSVTNLRAMNINAKTIDVVLSRIEEGLLSPSEKEEIASIVLELSDGRSAGNPPFNKKWLAHFFVRLLQVNREIEVKETPIRLLVSSLQKYFMPAKVVDYDIENYHFAIKSTGAEGEHSDELSLSELSSGEKQLVSVLSHLHFMTHKKVNIIIDEPELSLSVPWQADFLPDIAGTAACNQIFAVTHSPFTYDHLSSSVVDFLPRPTSAPKP
ncbi:MAG: AAA family ATPase [Patescibacteria group bacterium]|jgi:predicted ATPase